MKNFLFSFFLLPFFLFSSDSHYQVAILGSGPCGLTAAIYTARGDLSTLVIEGNAPGGQITLSYQVDNFPGFPEGISGLQLAENMKNQAARFGASFSDQFVSSIDFSKRPFQIVFENQEMILADSLILAIGSSPKWLGLDSEQKFIGKGVNTCALCDGAFYKDEEVLVVGGGDSALEDALFLSRFASKVTVVHRRDSLRASSFLQKKAFENPNIHFLFNTEVIEILDSKKGFVKGAILQNHETKETKELSCQGIFIAIGQNPNTDLFKNSLALDEKGYIFTKPFSTETDVLGVFAAGDVVDSHYRQAITAAGSGCQAAIDCYHFLEQFK